MNVFLSNHGGSSDAGSVLSSIQSFFSPANGYQTVPEACPAKHSFIVRKEGRTIWNKVFFSVPLSFQAAEMAAELSRMESQFLGVESRFFFPSGQWSLKDLEGFPKAEYYQYTLAEAMGEKALILEKMSPKISPTYKTENSSEKGREVRHQVLLKEELSELIDLSLDLKAI